jgi:hypothetical protein
MRTPRVWRGACRMTDSRAAASSTMRSWPRYACLGIVGVGTFTREHEFGKKDHTTVMYARDKVKDIMARDEAYRNKVRSLIALCQTA